MNAKIKTTFSKIREYPLNKFISGINKSQLHDLKFYT